MGGVSAALSLRLAQGASRSLVSSAVDQLLEEQVDLAEVIATPRKARQHL
jgi:hypothetical protein